MTLITRPRSSRNAPVYISCKGELLEVRNSFLPGFSETSGIKGIRQLTELANRTSKQDFREEYSARKSSLVRCSAKNQIRYWRSLTGLHHCPDSNRAELLSGPPQTDKLLPLRGFPPSAPPKPSPSRADFLRRADLSDNSSATERARCTERPKGAMTITSATSIPA